MVAVNDAVVYFRSKLNLRYYPVVADIVDQRSARAHNGDCRGLGGRRKIQNGSSIGKLQHGAYCRIWHSAIFAVDLTCRGPVLVVFCSDYGLVIVRE